MSLLEANETKIDIVKNDIKKKIKKDKVIKVYDKNSEKYKIVLKYVNKLLENIEGKQQITDLTQFKKIDRLDIIKECNKVILDEMKSEILTHFSKRNSGFDRIESINVNLNVLRCICKELGYKLAKTHKNIIVKTIIKTHYYYTIVMN
jgi:hypothetical protein